MSTFSSILSSMSSKPQTPQQPTDVPKSNESGQVKRPSSLAIGGRPTSSNAVAGVKRKSEEPEVDTKVKAAKLGSGGLSSGRPAPPTRNRFQLSSKPSVSQTPNGVPHRPGTEKPASLHPEKYAPKSTLKPASANETNAPSPTVPQKRGFASIMEKAKAAQEAAKAVPPSGIQHKAVEKLTKRERLRLAEEAKAQQKAAKGRKLDNVNQSKGDKPSAGLQKGHESSYKGTIKKAAEPLSYRGTMRTAATGEKEDKKQKGQAQDKYGGYASWSDLDEAEDEEDEEEDYDSEGSSDMEGGFDDVEREESLATRAARKEDQEFLEEEERLKREKLDRKRRLEELSKGAASRKKY